MRFLAFWVALCLGSVAWAQSPPKPDLTLTVIEDEAKLIVQMLDAIQCQNVAQLQTCIKAMALKAKLQEQIIGQVPK